MKLRIYNNTASDITYLGILIVAANSFLDIDAQYFNDLEVDPNLRNDLIISNVDISDTIVRYGNNDGIAQLNWMKGLRDSEGNGITSTSLSSTVRALDVNIVSSAPVSVGNTLIKYNEALAVASGATQTILTYTVPNSTTTIVKRISISGENIATYKVIYNTNTIATLRTYFGGELDSEINFIDGENSGFTMAAGETITIQVLNFRPMIADFSSTLQIMEMT